MVTTFLEPGGDATYDLKLWLDGPSFSPSIQTDLLHGAHAKSIGFTGASDFLGTTGVADSGGRLSCFTYFKTVPANGGIIAWSPTAFGGGTRQFTLVMWPDGTLQFYNNAGSFLGGSSAGSMPLSAYHRLSVAWTISSTTVNEIRCWVDGISIVSITNATLSGTGMAHIAFGDASGVNINWRLSDVYIDDSPSLTDPGNIWVTAKRPFSNGTTNGFGTVGSASGYGSGHAGYVNERPLSTTNRLSVLGTGSAVTEEFTIERAAVGDFDISTSTLIDYMGWAYASAVISETGQIIVGGTSTNVALVSADTMFLKAKGSAVYPAGDTDIGLTTSTTVTTVALSECGLLFAFIPGPPGTTPQPSLAPQRSGIFSFIPQRPGWFTAPLYVNPAPGSELRPSPGPQRSQLPFALRAQSSGWVTIPLYVGPLPGAEQAPSQTPARLSTYAFRPQRQGDILAPYYQSPAPGSELKPSQAPQRLGIYSFQPQRQGDLLPIAYVAPLPGAESPSSQTPARLGVYAFRSTPSGIFVPPAYVAPLPGAELKPGQAPQLSGVRALRSQPGGFDAPVRAPYIAPLPGAELHPSQAPQRLGVYAFRPTPFGIYVPPQFIGTVYLQATITLPNYLSEAELANYLTDLGLAQYTSESGLQVYTYLLSLPPYTTSEGA